MDAPLPLHRPRPDGGRWPWVLPVGPPSQGRWFAAGMIAAAGVVADLGIVPVVAAIGIVVAVIGEWAATGERDRLHGLGIGALTGLAIGRGLFGRDLSGRDLAASAWWVAVSLAVTMIVLPILPAATARRRLVAAAAATTGGLVTLWFGQPRFHP